MRRSSLRSAKSMGPRTAYAQADPAFIAGKHPWWPTPRTRKQWQTLSQDPARRSGRGALGLNQEDSDEAKEREGPGGGSQPGSGALSGEDALKLLDRPDVVFVDVREGEELQKTGKLKGAVHVPRGFLEFQADPTSPTHQPEFGGDKKLVLYCGSGNRSVLGAKTLKAWA